MHKIHLSLIVIYIFINNVLIIDYHASSTRTETETKFTSLSFCSTYWSYFISFAQLFSTQLSWYNLYPFLSFCESLSKISDYFCSVICQLNIIWGEAGDSDDHIVPYPDQIEEKPPIFFGDYTKKELNQEILDVTHVEQKKPTIIRTEYGNELECSSKYDTGDPAIGLAPPLLNAGKADHDFMGPPISSRMTEISQSCSSKGD